MSDRIRQTLAFSVLWLGLFAFALPAHASFVGTQADFSLIEPDPPGAPFLDKKVNVVIGSGLEVYGGVPVGPGDIGDIGDIMVTGVLQSEHIDIGLDGGTGNEYVEFKIFGGGAETSTGSGFRKTGAPDDTKYQIDFAPGVLALFETPTSTDLVLDGITGVALGSELMLGVDSLMLFIDTLGVETSDNFGTARLNFTLAEIPEIPIPAALPLMLSGLAFIGFLARRKKA